MTGRFCSLDCYRQHSRKRRRKEGVRYRMTRMPDHPLAPPSGVLAVSRVVLYEKIGSGPHKCHWCGTAIDWKQGGHFVPGALLADHVDFDPSNDTAENLVPSCDTCNSHRTAENDRRLLRPGEPVLMMKGRPTRAVERTCKRCGASFLALPALARKGKARYCSRECAYARNR